MQTGVCKTCGPVKIVIKSGYWRCRTARKESRGHWTKGVGYMTMNERRRRIASQSGKCGICGKEATLCRDHDHTTGADRGFICGDCNKGLGFFKDNPEILESAATYLHWHDTNYETIQKDVVIAM